MAIARVACCAAGVFAGVLMAAPVSARSKVMQGFPTYPGGDNRSKALVAVDLENDEELEIVGIAGEGITVIHRDGGIRKGFPVKLRAAGDDKNVIIRGGPTVCDLNGNGVSEIIVAASNRKVFAIDRFGAPVAGFPVSIKGDPKAGVACVPVSGGKHDIVLTTDAGLLLRIAATGGKAKTLSRIGKGAESGVAVADLDGDGKLDFITGGGDSEIYIVDERGKKRPGFSYRTSFRVSGTPAVGDINDDGAPEIVFGSQDFKIHAINLKGESLPGFPVATEYRIYGGASLADLNRDGVLDVISGSGDRKIYAVDGRGKAIKGFPARVDERISTDCVLADLDRDGRPDVVAVTESGSLYAVKSNGKRFRGFPQNLGGKGTVSPVVADFDGDDIPDIIAQARDGKVYVFLGQGGGKASHAVVAWGMAGHDPGRSGRYWPNPGRFKDQGYEELQIFTTNAVRVKYNFFDLDGDREGDTQIRWYVNGKRVSDLDNAREVPSARTRKHERWRYTLQDGENFKRYGETGPLSDLFYSPDVEIRNSQPTAPKLVLSPDDPTTVASLQVAISEHSQDADGDRLLYRYRWLKDGVPRKLSQSTTSIPKDRTRKNEEWMVVVVPFDGEEEGMKSTARVRILNTPPGMPAVSLSPRNPLTDSEIKVSIVRPAPDVDADKPTYEYRYWVNGKPLFLPLTSGVVPPRTVRKHETLRVQVTAVDDEQSGGSVQSELKLGNTAPEPPSITIWPDKPNTTSPLALGIVGQAVDRDHDQIALRHQWYVDGKPVEHPLEVPASATQKGQRWKLEVTPYDGEATGKPTTAETTILNTPPSAPVLSLEKYVLNTDVDVAPKVVVASQDPDGDPVRLRYVWSKNGKKMRLPDSMGALAAKATTKGDKWEVQITPFDGVDTGTPTMLSFSVINSPPAAPDIALSSTTPSARDTVEVKVRRPAPDKDGDPLTYRYRWFKDGVAQASWPPDKTSLAPGEAKKGEHWRVEVRAFDGEEEGELAKAELQVRNHEPDLPTVALSPRVPKTTDDLTCTVKTPAQDVDGDTVSYRTRWHRGEAGVPLSLDLTVLPASMTREKDRWTCSVQAFDGEDVGKTVRSQTVTVINSPPVAAQVSVYPAQPTTTDALTCELAAPATDADGDPIAYEYRWFVDGKPLSKKAGGKEKAHWVPAEQTRRGQSWSCEVVPSDGETDGARARGVVTVLNTAPTAPRVELSPEKPRAGDTLTCNIVEESTDVDGDELTYSFEWTRDGRRQDFAPTSKQVPGRLVNARDIWACKAIASDGNSAGPSAASQDVLALEAVEKTAVEARASGSSDKEKRRKRRRRRK